MPEQPRTRLRCGAGAVASRPTRDRPYGDRRPMQRQRAFTLIELLIVVGVIAMLLSILLPAMARAKHEAKRVLCLSNLRQMGIAAQSYVNANNESYPIAYYIENRPPLFVSVAWDFTTTKDWSEGGDTSIEPGLLWQGKTIMKIHQCPSFKGKTNWYVDPYTGYNYNTSYIGHGSGEATVAPAKATDVRRPDECALFGDGEYASGANKFMRAPWPDEEHGGDSFFGRAAGTQGFRHLDKTNVVFCDGHGTSLGTAYKDTDPAEVSSIAKGTGFLSPDNRLYDLQ